MTGSPGQEPPAGGPRSRLLRTNRHFRRLWSATLVSQLGTQVSELAMPLAAILVLRAGPLEVGLLAACGYLPAAMLGLPAGAWADRTPRRRILVAADVTRCLALATVPVASLLGALTIGQLYAVAFWVGALSVFFDVAAPAYLPSLVGRADLAGANARLQVGEQGAAVLGPGLAGWLVGLAGAPLAITAQAASYLASATLLARIRLRDERPAGRQAGQTAGRTRLSGEIMAGLREVAASRPLLAIAIAAAIVNLFGRMIVVLVPLYLVRGAGYGAGLIGAVFAIGSAGFLLGAMAADYVARLIGLARSILIGGTVAGASFLLIAAAPPADAGAFVAAAMVVYGVGAMTFSVAAATLRQLVTPSQLLGRVISSTRLLTWIAQPVAGVLAGLLAARLGLHAAFWLAALGALLTPVPLLGARLVSGPAGGQSAAVTDPQL